MKLVSWESLVDLGGYSKSAEFQLARKELEEAIDGVRWPLGAEQFTIHPEPGKDRGRGNGVVPMKKAFAAQIGSKGWELERRAPRDTSETEVQKIIKGSKPGAFDAHRTFESGVGPFAAEWETGNISSSHRAINRIGLGINKGYISGGVLILPTARLAHFLTDRIGNYPELKPYWPLWEAWKFQKLSYFGIVAIEHDVESESVPRMPKGTDGRAQG